MPLHRHTMTMHVVGTRPRTVPPSQSVVLNLSAVHFVRFDYSCDFWLADLTIQKKDAAAARVSSVACRAKVA